VELGQIMTTLRSFHDPVEQGNFDGHRSWQPNGEACAVRVTASAPGS
jgi:hypothetical protein